MHICKYLASEMTFPPRFGLCKQFSKCAITFLPYVDKIPQHVYVQGTGAVVKPAHLAITIN